MNEYNSKPEHKRQRLAQTCPSCHLSLQGIPVEAQALMVDRGIREGLGALTHVCDSWLTCGVACVQLRRTRHQMYQHINADYYGFRDEEDGVLEKVEAEAERSIRHRVSSGDCMISL